MKLYSLLALFLMIIPALALDPFQEVKDACIQSDGSVKCMVANFNFGIDITFKSDVSCFSQTSAMDFENMSNCYATVSLEKDQLIETKYAIKGEFLAIEYQNSSMTLKGGNYEAAISPETLDLSKCVSSKMESQDFYSVACSYNGTRKTADLSAAPGGTLIIAKIYDKQANWEIILYIIIGAVILALGYLIMKGRDKR